jgi:hypothetical protein
MYEKYLHRLRGRGEYSKAQRVGNYDVHVLFALSFNWTDAQTDQCDPDFVEQLEQQLRAQSTYEKGEAEKRKRKGLNNGKGKRAAQGHGNDVVETLSLLDLEEEEGDGRDE